MQLDQEGKRSGPKAAWRGATCASSRHTQKSIVDTQKAKPEECWRKRGQLGRRKREERVDDNAIEGFLVRTNRRHASKLWPWAGTKLLFSSKKNIDD
jgi:hypothetical protein